MIRKHYRACIKDHVTKTHLQESLSLDQQMITEKISHGNCWTVALYQHETMLFLYYEDVADTLTPDQLFPETSKYLELWPEKDKKTAWAQMYHIYYHAIPTSNEQWERTEKKIRRGRIAYLHPDKLFSYTYYHQALVNEGLLEGDQYQSIALHENILFSYFEEPKKFTHIRHDCQESSKVIDEWLAVDPESHFDHTLSGQDNFLFIEELFSMGLEDIH